MLSRCNSISASAPGAYGDPDFLEVAIYLVLKAGKTFLDSLFNGGGPEGIADVAELIRRAPSVATNGEFHNLLSTSHLANHGRRQKHT
jgi:hypothetical protein